MTYWRPHIPRHSTTAILRRACEEASLMRNFLREHLTKDKIELNEDGFEMLCGDFLARITFTAVRMSTNERRANKALAGWRDTVSFVRRMRLATTTKAHRWVEFGSLGS